jgi:hypothetical protein
MSDQPGSDEDRKVVRLFPRRNSEPDGGLERKPALDWQDVDAVEREIRGVLHEAAVDRPPDPELPSGPDPSHRNAVRCSQCDGYTWRRTRYCRHCNADLVALAAERRQGVLWAAAIASWGLGLGCFYLVQHYVLPAKIRAVLMTAVLVIAGVNVFGFWLASLPERR